MVFFNFPVGYTVGIIISIIIVLVIAVIIIIQLNKPTVKIKNQDILINLDKNQGNGRALGRILKVETGADGQEIIEFQPTDLTLEEREDDIIPEPEHIIVNKGMSLTLTQGFHSKASHMKIVFPPTPDDYSEEMKGQFIGKSLQIITGMKMANNATIESYKHGMLAIESHTEDMGAGEVSKKEMNRFIGLNKDMFDVLIREAKKDKPNTSLNPTFDQHSN